MSTEIFPAIQLGERWEVAGGSEAFVCGIDVISLNYPGGRISTRRVLCALGGTKFRLAPTRDRTSTVVVGAYNFVRSTGTRTVRGVLRTTGCGSRNGLGTLVIANYLTRECRGSIATRVPRISIYINVNSGNGVTRVIGGTVRNGYRGSFNLGASLSLGNGHVLNNMPFATCLGVTSNYGGYYACYTVPGVHNRVQDEAVRSYIGRTGRLTRGNMGRLVIITRSAATCNDSVCKGPVLSTLLHRLYGVSKVR